MIKTTGGVFGKNHGSAFVKTTGVGLGTTGVYLIKIAGVEFDKTTGIHLIKSTAVELEPLGYI